MPRPEKKVHIPLDFKEALSDLLKVEPEPEPEPEPDQEEAEGVKDADSGGGRTAQESGDPTKS